MVIGLVVCGVLTVTGLTNAEYLISSVALSIDEYYAGVGESPGVWAGRWAEAWACRGWWRPSSCGPWWTGKHPVTGERSVGGEPATFGAGVRSDLFGAQERVAVVGARVRSRWPRWWPPPTGRRSRWRWGSWRSGPRWPGCSRSGVRRRVAHRGLGGGGVRAPHEPGGRPPAAHPLSGPEPGAARTATAGTWLSTPARCSSGPGRPGRSTRTSCSGPCRCGSGWCWGPDRNNTREMVGFSRAQLRAFSKRSAQIEAELEAKGALYESPALRMRADDEASLATRTAKDHSLTPSAAGRAGGRSEAGAGRPGRRGRSGAGGVLGGPGLGARPAGRRSAAALVDPEVGLCSRSARFTTADVVEHICALSGGRLDRGGDHRHGRPVPRLGSGGAPDARCRGGPAPAGAVVDRRAPGAGGPHRGPDRHPGRPARSRPSATAAVEAALAAAPGLGEDQVAAVQGADRGGRQPAGGARPGRVRQDDHAARRGPGRRQPTAGRWWRWPPRPRRWPSWPAPAWTPGRSPGCASTWPTGRWRRGRWWCWTRSPRPPPREVEAVLAAVDACPGGSAVGAGRPPPVPAGRRRRDRRPHRAARHRRAVIPSARLTVNRRQVDAADREALDLLRRGDAAASQQLRAEHGWEHEHASPGETRQAMADGRLRPTSTRYGAEAGGGAGRVPHRRRGPGRPDPGPPRRHRRARPARP